MRRLSPRALIGSLVLLAPLAGVATTATAKKATKTSGCHVRGQLPDSACTPGSAFPNAGVAEICQPGYTTRVRHVLSSTKRAVYAAYGISTHGAGQYEIDHLIPLELGGNNTRANIWPEAAPGYHKKDTVENELHAAVCSGQISLHTAQARIAHDWRHAALVAPGSVTTPTPALPPTPTPTPSPVPVPPDASFCATHSCILNFDSGQGTIVQCADGLYSHSGGLAGACSGHGGVKP